LKKRKGDVVWNEEAHTKKKKRHRNRKVFVPGKKEEIRRKRPGEDKYRGAAEGKL